MGSDNKKMGYGGYGDQLKVNPSSKKQRRLSLPTMGMRKASPSPRRGKRGRANTENLDSSGFQEGLAKMSAQLAQRDDSPYAGSYARDIGLYKSSRREREQSEKSKSKSESESQSFSTDDKGEQKTDFTKPRNSVHVTVTNPFPNEKLPTRSQPSVKFAPKLESPKFESPLGQLPGISFKTDLTAITESDTPTGSDSQNPRAETPRRQLFKECDNIWDVFIKLRPLGKGFCCDVFLVRYRSPHRRGKFALKVLQQDELGLMLFKREIRMLKMVDHPGIVKFYDAYKDDKHYAMLVEYLSGGELFDRVMSKGRFSEDSGADLIKSILESVAYMHDNEISHRDLKLENIMYDSRLRPRVIDFGFATKIRSNKSYDIVGACLFLSPELVLCSRDPSKDLTGEMLKACDMWATGVITYAILTGCHLFFGETDADIMDGILRGHINFNKTNLSINAKDFIRKLLTKDPTRRLTAHDCLRHPWILSKNLAMPQRDRRARSVVVR